MEDDGGESSSFVVGIIENRAKEVSYLDSLINIFSIFYLIKEFSIAHFPFFSLAFASLFLFNLAS